MEISLVYLPVKYVCSLQFNYITLYFLHFYLAFDLSQSISGKVEVKYAQYIMINPRKSDDKHIVFLAKVKLVFLPRFGFVLFLEISRMIYLMAM